MFKAEIIETGKEITSAKERVMLKDTRSAIRLDEATLSDGSVDIYPTNYAILKVTNDRSEDGEYTQYLIVDENGTKYLTGSESFFSSFIAIYDEMKDTNEPYGIKVYRQPSKKYAGKDFITCTII